MRKSQEESLWIAGLCFLMVGLLIVAAGLYGLVSEVI